MIKKVKICEGQKLSFFCFESKFLFFIQITPVSHPFHTALSQRLPLTPRHHFQILPDIVNRHLLLPHFLHFLHNLPAHFLTSLYHN